ncbi:radical SAM protein [Vibrio tubiashii]|uniref:B12-binding domain-containing radical SAM protein n=1 Tax=Vibrio tubiashii TaxID=29498 RepID=UPI001EFCD0D9|nr:radical SAM protein [Vibrio tubiashii]MCG9578815.1 radical SAM protein [Vibrio tubiashii]
MIKLIRPPQQSFYNDLDLREDNFISYFLGYCQAQNITLDYQIHDFVLDKNNSLKSVYDPLVDTYVIFTRETGSNPHYTIRLANALSKQNKTVIIYGQVARFRHLPISDIQQVTLIEQNERELLTTLCPSVSPNPDITFEYGFVAQPYFTQCTIQPERRHLFKAAIETTRGCEFSCDFCYISQNLGEKFFVSRSAVNTLNDIEAYYRHGVRHFVFMDSEFIGLTKARHQEVRAIAQGIIARFPDIKFMIYSRADTLAKFGELALLKQAGLVNVFIGVESLDEHDLIEMNKNVRKTRLIASITHLMEQEIYMTLSFITFNRNTTIDSLRTNIETLKALHAHPNKAFLGMPNFLFNMESSWSGAGEHKLSDKTYIKWLLFYKDQPDHETAIFDARFEPLMEVYRIAHYEITKKSAQLNYRLEDTPEVEAFFDLAPEFALGIMALFLEKFESGELNIDSIRDHVAELYEYFGYFYQKILDSELADLQTSEGTLALLEHPSIPYVDHGWDSRIPLSGGRLQ